MSIQLTTPTHIHVKGIAYLLTEVSHLTSTAILQVWDSPDQVEGADRELTLYIDDPLPEDGYTVKADGSVYRESMSGNIEWIADIHILSPDIEVYTGQVTDTLQ